MSERDARIIRLELNGAPVTMTVEPRETLADALRRQHGTRGVRLGCEHGACGACTVLLDGSSARSCLLFAVQTDGSRVDTAEGLAESNPVYQRLVRVLSESNAFQCGFCATGMLVTATELLNSEPCPDEARIRDRLAGNLCRCTGYQSIVAGVARAAVQPAESEVSS
jgi:carbon-monoxide dehydrogenase small subunit